MLYFDRKPKQENLESSLNISGQHDTASSEIPDSNDKAASTGLPFSATVDPLLVHIPPHPPRPPTLQECQAIVKHLYTAGSQQAREVGASDDTDSRSFKHKAIISSSVMFLLYSSTTAQLQPPERAILSHIDCLSECENVGLEVF